jgi:hypothetical protein
LIDHVGGQRPEVGNVHDDLGRCHHRWPTGVTYVDQPPNAELNMSVRFGSPNARSSKARRD